MLLPDHPGRTQPTLLRVTVRGLGWTSPESQKDRLSPTPSCPWLLCIALWVTVTLPYKPNLKTPSSPPDVIPLLNYL